MGDYLNPGASEYQKAVRAPIFVDKTEMLRFLNSVVDTKRGYICVSRPRRFGKTYAADMICAYYGRGADSRGLFEGLKISETEPVAIGGEELAWDCYLGAFDVVSVTVTGFVKKRVPVEKGLDRMQRLVCREIVEAYPDADYFDTTDLPLTMADAYKHSGRPFVVVIDEWDAPMRERKGDGEGQRVYLDFLRDLLKDKKYVALAYMTGILPIKKYGTHSALNMFEEYTMVSPKALAGYVGFTDEEVRQVCETHDADYASMREWYDGYRLTRGSGTRRVTLEVYNPLSVASAAANDEYVGYWGQSEVYEALAEYVRMDFDGLKAKVAIMMEGGRVGARLSTYKNDMSNLASADDVIALLIHLGYLGWDSEANEAFVPNQEVLEVFRDSTTGPAWNLAFRELRESRELLASTLKGDERAVAAGLEAAHDRAANRDYNSEAALSYALQLAYYAAYADYTILPELDSGKGYADLVWLPRPGRPDLPALVAELKYKDAVNTGMDQIKARRYDDRLGHYWGNMLLVSVSYDPDAKAGDADYKRHTCAIERR